MDELNSLEAELRRLDDLIDTVESKIHNLTGLLELMCLGIRRLNKVDDSYELSGVNVVQEYLESIEKTDIPVIHEKLSNLKKLV